MPEASEDANGETSVLDQDRRRLIYETLSNCPGLNLSQLIRETDLSSGVVRHHLEILQEAGLVRRRKGERADEVLFFTAEDDDLWAVEEGRALFGHATRRRVALYIAENPESSAGEIAEAFEVDSDTIRYHVDTLVEEGLVEPVSEVPPRRVVATDPMNAWLEAVAGRERPQNHKN